MADRDGCADGANGDDAGGNYSNSNPLEIRYEDHEHVRELLDTIRFCLEDFSLSFDTDDPERKAPGMYLAVVAGRSLSGFADPMGDERWPVEVCREVFDDLDGFCAAASDVARTRDGAVVVSVDGVIQEKMVRFRDYAGGSSSEDPEYADWMGTRHMSALDTSRRESVVATVTLSQETGRVTVFQGGEYESVEREALAARWRGQEE